jgi:catechol 2,3-dioxygenase-like lactoylglutathione lyase family enzyme
MRYIGEAAPNFDEAVAFYRDAWGLTVTEKDNDIAFFAAEGSPEQYVFRLRRAEEKRIDVIGFGVDDAATVDAFGTQLAAEGYRFASEPGPLQTPGGGYGFRFFDPDGRTIEISSDVATRPYREIEERESIPRKLGHIVLGSANFEASKAFFQETLGFVVSDVILGGLTFMRCTPDHHGLAIGPVKDTRLNHIAFEFRGIDEQLRATGRVLKVAPMRVGPVRHLFGDNVSSYFFDPNGNVSEITCAIEQVPLENGRAPRVITPEENQEFWHVAKRMDPDQVPENHLSPEGGHWVAPPI